MRVCACVYVCVFVCVCVCARACVCVRARGRAHARDDAHPQHLQHSVFACARSLAMEDLYIVLHEVPQLLACLGDKELVAIVTTNESYYELLELEVDRRFAACVQQSILLRVEEAPPGVLLSAAASSSGSSGAEGEYWEIDHSYW